MEAWDGYLEVRKKKRAPSTERALRLTINKLEQFRLEGYSPTEVLDQSIQRGWIGVFAVYGQEPKRVLRDKHGNAYRVTADGFRQLIPESEVIQ
jgi:hypothetical protein